MKKYFFAPLILSSFLFVGCTPPMAMTHFEKNKLYSNALQYTKKADILFQNEVKVMMNVTYLNSVDSMWDNEYENFIVGVYVVEDENHKTEDFLSQEAFKLTLNGREYISKEFLDKNHKMLNNIPLFNSWAKYYVIKFEKNSEDTTLVLTLENTTFGRGSVSFRPN
ncbi:MAG: hypothetical protein ACNI3C_09995 [Candidatus Marinarcus sp.]|uniref:hypothetical protein n=1 Tax=Candidatus Marinarcus sp. TaxID=3100987 RepID=UPI003AFFDA93